MICTGVAKLTCCQPLAVSFVKDGGGQAGAGDPSRVRDMGAGVRRALVEARPCGIAGAGRLELRPKLHRAQSSTDVHNGRIGLELNGYGIYAGAALTVRDADALAVPPRPSEIGYVNAGAA